MSKYESSELQQQSLDYLFYLYSKQTGKTITDVKIDIRNRIITELFDSGQLQQKLKGMLFRNGISASTFISDDVLQTSFLELSKYDIDKLFLAYCENPKRILALIVTITKRSGFGKMNGDVSPNQSVAKQILFTSNLGNNYTPDSNDGHVSRKYDINEIPEYIEDENDLWEIIRSELNSDELEFLDFILKNVFNRKYTQAYSEQLRHKYYTYNEYKVRRLSLQNRITEILQKNKLKP